MKVKIPKEDGHLWATLCVTFKNKDLNIISTESFHSVVLSIKLQF